MLYISLDSKELKILLLKKTLLGQYELRSFEKKHEAALLDEKFFPNTDILASAIKEGIETVSSAVKDKDVVFIIPQSAFQFLRTEVPADIAPSALHSFIQDKARSNFLIDLDICVADSFVKEQNFQKQISLYVMQKELVQKYQDVCSLLDLKITAIIPETLAYFKLFEKTLRKEKKEIILYAHCDSSYLKGYVYDSFGLLQPEVFRKTIKDEASLESAVKEKASDYESQGLKLNRVILSGLLSENVRQDTFTKSVGVWMNPLKRIIPDFYKDYLKQFIIPPQKTLPMLPLDVCFGAFLFAQENKNFSLLKNKFTESKKIPVSFSFPNINVSKREMLLFISSFALSFLLFLAVSRLNAKSLFQNISRFQVMRGKISPTPTPVPPTPTPTPAIKKDVLKIKILNGSGIRGKANEVKEALKTLEYQEILTGNADNFDNETTKIQVKKGSEFLAEHLKKELTDYTSSAIIESLDDKENADVVIIVGKDFK